ncbi:MAG: rRNA maturation RNase YbeY [Acidobacteriaceae bacterium]
MQSHKISLIVDPLRRLRRRQLEEFAEAARVAVKLRGEVTVLLTSNERIQQLNRQYRKKNKATDVLSFPAPENLRKEVAGDLAISMDIAAEYARRLGHSLTKELCVLILHGIIHLAGHDHETDNGEMATLEAKLRKRFGLPLSLIERTGTERTGRGQA